MCMSIQVKIVEKLHFPKAPHRHRLASGRDDLPSASLRTAVAVTVGRALVVTRDSWVVLLLHSWASKAGGRGDTSPAIKIAGGTSPPKICMKISNSDYFNGFKLDPFKFHHNFSIFVAILDRTKPIHVLTSAIKKHMSFHWFDPKETAEMRPPPQPEMCGDAPATASQLWCSIFYIFIQIRCKQGITLRKCCSNFCYIDFWKASEHQRHQAIEYLRYWGNVNISVVLTSVTLIFE